LYAIGAYREGFPDLRITVDRVIADIDDVVGYGRIAGTHTGNFFGTQPTGKTIAFGYIDIYHINEGLITEAFTGALAEQSGWRTGTAERRRRIAVPGGHCPHGTSAS
jgi:predicted ester cyclase